MKRILYTFLAIILAASLGLAGGAPTKAFHEGGLVLLSSNTYTWTDPASGGVVHITENVYEGVLLGREFIPHDMTWEYTVHNFSYNPRVLFTNGFSGFQIIFPGPVPELYNKTSPGIGGPWLQNAFSGVVNGMEWDAPLPGVGIMPGQRGVFSFATHERVRFEWRGAGGGRGPGGWGHTWGEIEPIIDADGTTTALNGLGVPANVQVRIGSPLTSWPNPGGLDVEGIDWLDNDWDGVSPRTWTAGDGLHVEGPAYPGAIRNALHDATDPVVLAPTPLGAAVSVDLEGNIDFGGGSGVDPRLKYYNANGLTNWDDREDIVLDLNMDGVFGTNTQTFIFHGPNSAPGRLFNELGIVESAGGEIAKKVKYIDPPRDPQGNPTTADGDDIIEVGEEIRFLMVIQVHNPTGARWTDVVVEDRLGAELESGPVPDGVPNPNATQGAATTSTQGNSNKLFLKWEVGDLGPGKTANLVWRVSTDLNPAGKQEYTTAGTYEFNSGVVLKFLVDGKQSSFETGSILVTVVEPD
ncbi:MAG: hypothetical protein HYX84_06140 [Chloroflexi bacterium]|nr:hypothetical protein [Chloroflexota bacterium]